MSERQMVRWEDISRGGLHSLFHVWTDSRQLQWAKKAWEALAKRGLTGYADEIEKTRVLLRLVTLGTFYREFCDLTWDEYFCPTEGNDSTYLDWVNELEISPSHITQCLGPDYYRGEKADDCDFVIQGVAELTDQERPSTYKALTGEFGGDSMLFVSLWNTVEYRDQQANDSDDDENEDLEEDGPPNGDYKEFPKRKPKDINWAEDAGTILNNATPEKLRSFEWLKEGMPRVR